MMGYLVFLLLVLTGFFGFQVFNAPVNELTKESVSQLLKITHGPNTIRGLYGEHGRSYTDDYKKYRTEQQVKSIVGASQAPNPFYLQKIEASNFAGNPSASPAPSSPYGVHGNNYSLYDINSPTGQFGKL